MTENRYAIGLDALEAGVRVGPADQVAGHPDPPPGDRRWDLHPYADGAGGDVDGD